MLEGHRRLVIPTLDGGELQVEVNWSKDPKIKGAQVLRIHNGDETFSVRRNDLTTLLLILGDEKTQKDLLPVNMRRVRKVERLLQGSFVAKVDYKKGDTIFWEAPWIDEIPIDEEVLSGNIGDLNNQMKQAKKKILI